MYLIPRSHLTGDYHSTTPNSLARLTQRLKNGSTNWIINSDMKVNMDSTFHFNTCGIEASGSWKVIDKSLVLFPSWGRFKNDSINKVRQGINIDTLRYKGLLNFDIQDNKLIAIVKKSKGGSTLLYLTKTND